MHMYLDVPIPSYLIYRQTNIIISSPVYLFKFRTTPSCREISKFKINPV